MANVLVFEDAQVDRLFPITIGRPAYAITCACYRLVQFLERLDVDVVSKVRSHLKPIQRLDFPFFSESLSSSEAKTLLVSARLIPSVSNFRKLSNVLQNADEQNAMSLDGVGNVVVAVVPTSQLIGLDDDQIQEFVNALKDQAELWNNDFEAFCFPHDLVRYNQECFGENIEDLVSSNAFNEVQDGLFVADGVSITENIAIDTSDGPIVIGENASVGPFSYFSGPVYIGSNCKVNEHSAIKEYVCLTDTVKVGGEIEATVIEPYSNKQHHGFLGHAYLGSWINIGAGTCNSDLKNTYGKVNMNYAGQKVATNLQFVGCIMGDYSKTAINSSIFTGKLIGVCSNIYGFVSENVPSFVNYAKSFGEMTLQSVDIMKTTQQRMFARRKVPQRECDLQLLDDMFRLSSGERPDGLSSKSPSL